MGSIYEVSAWAPSKAYKTNDIVSQGGLFYYAKQDHTSGLTFDSSLWNGITTVNGKTKPLFFWKPTYNSVVSQEPRVKLIKFGDSYEQRSSDGISNTLLTIELSFELKTNQEAAAILHFLYARAGVESFMWTPPAPFNTQKRFVCRAWTNNFNFYDNNSIKAKFEEVAN